MTTPVSPSAAAPRTRRQLSPLRLFIALVVTAAVVAGALFGMQRITAQATPEKPAGDWFAGYVDVTATPRFAFESPATPAARNVVLSFIVASAEDACSPSWGAAYSLDEASETLDLDRRIARLEQQGGEVTVSFGGLLNDELGAVCTDTTKLAAAYQSVIDRYRLTTIDLDIEGATLADVAANARRASVVLELQKKARASGDDLAVWLTLPVADTGLAPAGQDAVRAFLDAGVDLAGVNAMTMDYGNAITGTKSMLEASTDALTALHRQLGILYRQQKTTLSDETLWSKIGATPMIGQNDVPSEVFGLAAAAKLNAFANDKGLGRMSMWSLNRDVACGSNYVNLKVVSDSCSGIAQGSQKFSTALGKGFAGSPSSAAGVVTTNEPVDPAELVDNPATSPYAIWEEENSYLEGTKIVWHRNVYVAKWWTRGDLPDDPVLNAWETPWQLVGPVMPGEKPIPVPTLPAGTYREWSGTAEYPKGVRVLFDGVPYESKWWNTAESPEASSANPDSSPWVPLTLPQIKEVIRDLAGT